MCHFAEEKETNVCQQTTPFTIGEKKNFVYSRSAAEGEWKIDISIENK